MYSLYIYLKLFVYSLHVFALFIISFHKACSFILKHHILVIDYGLALNHKEEICFQIFHILIFYCLFRICTDWVMRLVCFLLPIMRIPSTGLRATMTPGWERWLVPGINIFVGTNSYTEKKSFLLF